MNFSGARETIRAGWPRLLGGIAAALVLAYGALLWSNLSRVVGGSDSSGYLNAARLFAAGKTSRAIPIPPELDVNNLDAFVPLGFVRQPGASTMVSFYPPGFPLHLLVAAWLAGWDGGPFYVSPLAALVVITLVFLLARRFVRTEVALLAALTMACCAVLIYQGVQPMSDVVAAAWCTAAAAAALWQRDTAAPALLAGTALGIAVLVRPPSLLMLVPLLLFLRPKQYLWAFLGAAPFAALLCWYNLQTFGSPLEGGYRTGGALEAFQFSGAMLRAAHHLGWTIRQLGPVVLIGSIASLGIPWTIFRIRLGFFLWFIAFLACYSLYDAYNTWWYTRYLLPAYPALLVTTAATAEHFLQRRTMWSRVTAALIAAITLGFAVTTTLHLRVFEVDEEQRPILRAAAWLTENLPPSSLLVGMEMSGATLSYTSHYPVRWERSNRQELKEWVQTAARHGRGSWAILMPHEVPEFRTRFGDLGRLVEELPPFQVFVLNQQ
jgi:hypothetical protein